MGRVYSLVQCFKMTFYSLPQTTSLTHVKYVSQLGFCLGKLSKVHRTTARSAEIKTSWPPVGIGAMFGIKLELFAGLIVSPVSYEVGDRSTLT